MTDVVWAQTGATPCATCVSAPPACEYPTMSLWAGHKGKGSELVGEACWPVPVSFDTWTGQTFTYGVMFEQIRPCLQWEPGVAYDITLTVSFSVDGYAAECELRIWQNDGESILRHSATHSATVPDPDSDPCTFGPSGAIEVASEWDDTGPSRVRAVLGASYNTNIRDYENECIIATCEGDEGPFSFGARWNDLVYSLSVEVEVP